MKKVFNNKKFYVIFVVLVCLVMAGYYIFGHKENSAENIEILNTKEARKKVFEEDKVIQKYLDDALSSEAIELIKDNYICKNDLYLKEAPDIEIIEEGNKRIRYLGEGYYLVEEFIKEGSEGTLEYYLADKDFKKIDCNMNSGKYDVILDSNERIVEMSQDSQLLYTMEYNGDDSTYYFETNNSIEYIKVNSETKDYEVMYSDGTSTKQKNCLIEENDDKYKVKYKNDLLTTKTNQNDNTQYNYYYDSNGLITMINSTYADNDRNQETFYFYDFENGYEYILGIIDDEIFQLCQYTIDFAYDPYQFFRFNVSDDFLKVSDYSYSTKQLFFSDRGKQVPIDEYMYTYLYEKKDQLLSVSCEDTTSEYNSSYGYEDIYDYDKEIYYCQQEDLEASQQGFYLKIGKLEKDKMVLYLKYYDKTNEGNDIQMFDDEVYFDQKTGEIEDIFFLNSLNDYVMGSIEWEDGEMYLTLRNSNNSQLNCKHIKLYENSEDDFMSYIGNEHDINLSFK